METRHKLQLLVAGLVWALLILPTPGLADQGPAVYADFNGDGFADLAIGVPNENQGSAEFAGAVHVLYGTATGLSATGNQFWTQNSPGVLDTAEADDDFGLSLAVGDFNGDSFADLAIGVPLESLSNNTIGRAGAVNVIYGSASGLSSTGNQFWTQNSPGVPDTAEAHDAFGGVLAVGDFNGDGFADLAIGVRGEDLGTVTDAGAVHVLYGTATGVSATGNQFWSQDSLGVLDTAELGDFFGSLAAGDFNGDGLADLAIGVFGEDLGPVTDAGAVHVLYGTAAGLSATGDQFWSQDSSGALDTAEPGELFGWSLAVGDFDGDSFADLAIGAYREDVGTVPAAGAVHVLYGSAAGLSATGDQFWTQDSPGILDTAEPGDNFGYSLAAGDFNGDGLADLAMGVPGEAVGEVTNTGAVHVLYGSAAGLSATGDQFWTQDSPGILDTADFDDAFGGVLSK
jgi:disulfide bond formation protein DsbB